MLGEIAVLLALGLVVGLAAGVVLPGRQTLPWWLTVPIGAAALLLAGALMSSADLLLRAVVGTVVAVPILALTHTRAPNRAGL